MERTTKGWVRIEDGEPCAHNGCSGHISHPCERCNRIAMKGQVEIPTSVFTPAEFTKLESMLSNKQHEERDNG